MKHNILNLWGRFKYKEIVMQPYMNLFYIATFLFSICIGIIDSVLRAVICIFIFLCCIATIYRKYLANSFPINDFVFARKHPFRRIYYIYQMVNDRKLIYFRCDDLRSLYFTEMQKVLDELKPGTYRTLTQPLFAREIMQDKNILVTTKIKAYKRKTVQLQNQVYVNRCRYCKKTHCSYRSSKAQKQFYYLEFTVLKG